jgi:HTH-type transcriptional regulator/antitoxin MqsA
MKCVACGGAEMVREVHDVSYTYKGQSTTIPDVSGDFCPVCNESLHSAEEARYLNSEMLAFNKEVNSTIVDPEFIIKTRKILNLDQRQAAELFGGGINAFSRYENGKTKPPLALVHLLKILSNHPELLSEIQTKKKESIAQAPATNKLTRRRKSSA